MVAVVGVLENADDAPSCAQTANRDLPVVLAGVPGRETFVEFFQHEHGCRTVHKLGHARVGYEYRLDLTRSLAAERVFESGEQIFEMLDQSMVLLSWISILFLFVSHRLLAAVQVLRKK